MTTRRRNPAAVRAGMAQAVAAAPPAPPPTAQEQHTNHETRRRERAEEFRADRLKAVQAYKDAVVAAPPGGLDWNSSSRYLPAAVADAGHADACQ